MAIAFDAAANGGGTGYTHTCSGTNRFMYFSVNGGGTSTTGVTYNGVSATKIDESATKYSHWYLINPASGSNTVATTPTSPALCSSSYTGVKQSGQPDATTAIVEHTNSQSETVSVTTVADNCWVLMTFGDNNQGTISAGANTTLRTSASNVGQGILDSNAAKTPAGSVSLICNSNAAATTTAGGGISIAPAPAAASAASAAPVGFYEV